MKNKNTHNKTIWKIILILSIILIIVAILLIGKSFTRHAGHDYKRGELMTTAAVQEIPSVSVSESELPENPIDFKALKKINPDIYAWITIPDTNIDYAVAQSGPDKDDFFYLSHNIEGKYEFKGTIYSEKQNSKDFTDPVTVLYGHNMLDGSMFADLLKLQDKQYFRKHKKIYIYTKGHILTYDLIAAYTYDNRHILNTFDFTDKEDLNTYFESILSPPSMLFNVRKNATLDINSSKILTLSTCTDNDSSSRFLVQGVLISNERTQ